MVEEDSENRYGDGNNFTLPQMHEIIDYVEESLWDQFTESQFECEKKIIEEMIDQKCEAIANKISFEMFEMRKELEQQFNLKAKRRSWKWWK